MDLANMQLNIQKCKTENQAMSALQGSVLGMKSKFGGIV